MRGLQEMGPLFSGIAERFITHRAYALATAEANLEGLLSPKVSACWLSSLVLLRRGEARCGEARCGEARCVRCRMPLNWG